jgi:hypothetical protein
MTELEVFLLYIVIGNIYTFGIFINRMEMARYRSKIFLIIGCLISTVFWPVSLVLFVYEYMKRRFTWNGIL